MSPELKNYIEKLKAEGDFRPEGLDSFKRSFLNEVGISLVGVMFVFLLTKNFYVLFSLFVVFYLTIRVLKICYAKPYLPYNEWNFTVGKVKHAQYIPLPISRSNRWFITSHYVMNGKEYTNVTRSPMSKKGSFLGGPLPETGSKIIIFYDKDSVESSKILIPITFSRTCLKQSHYDTIMKLYYGENQ